MISEAQTTVIRPTRAWAALNLREVWAHRELLYFLAWRDVKVRYKQAVLGMTWVIIQPVFMMIVFTLIFGRLAALPSDDVPHPLFIYAGLLPWNLFSGSLTRSVTSVVGNTGLIQKVYFPRLLIPLSSTLAVVVDFAFAFLVVIALMVYYSFEPPLTVFLMPFFVVLATAAALGAGLWLSALYARFRDVGHAVPFLLQAWLYASPIAYSTSLIPERWRALYSVNPLVGVVQGFRWSMLGKGEAPGGEFAISVAVTALLLVTGAMFFRRMERTFADIV